MEPLLNIVSLHEFNPVKSDYCPGLQLIPKLDDSKLFKCCFRLLSWFCQRCSILEITLNSLE